MTITQGRLRQISGLVLLVFVCLHLLNHMAGLVSIALMNDLLSVSVGIWRTPAGGALLALAAAMHIGVALKAVYDLKSLRMPPWQALQILSGLAIPFLLAEHVAATRLAAEALGLTLHQVGYTVVLIFHFAIDPSRAVLQIGLVVLVWAHASLGLHFWLRVKPWYGRAFPVLFGCGLLLPALSIAGYIAAGQEVRPLGDDAADLELALLSRGIDDRYTTFVDRVRLQLMLGFAALVALVLAARQVRVAIEARTKKPRLLYRDGRKFDIAPGMTVLDILRAQGVPHASVCGGRGRCSTCRVRIGIGLDGLQPPDADEQRVLSRISAPEGVRLACQIRPSGDLEVTPLLPPTATAKDGFARAGYHQGEEREIAIMFADLRGFTKLSSHKLPYDVVFILNRYFAAMGEAIVGAGGRLDKFLGDGIMALFGIEGGPDEACRAAVEAARRMSGQLDILNEALAAELPEPLRMGIGIHLGPAIVGDMGYGDAKALTAIGDAVNTAARLEGLSKQYRAELVISRDVAERLDRGLDLRMFSNDMVEIRGKDGRTEILYLARAKDVAARVGGKAA